MKRLLIAIFFIFFGINIAHASVNLNGFSIIREFGGTDNAAMFGVLSSSGKLQITRVFGPSFLGSCRTGELNESSINHIFQNSSKPLEQQERNELISKYKGAQIMYFEGYRGNLCTNDEIEYEITADGNVDGQEFEVTYQIIALPNSNGDCTFHKFIVQTQTQHQLNQLFPIN